MNVLFLDFDGVINTYWWNSDGTKFEIGYKDKCTNFQAVQWISHFCEKHNYYIVVSSTWRIGVCLDRLKNILMNSGMPESVVNTRLIGKTPVYCHDHATRGEEINDWLIKHPDVNHYIIVDDDDDFECFPEMRDHLVKTNFYVGFTIRDFMDAEDMHKKLKREKK